MTKWVVITGASSGIGQALTICFCNSGYNVLAIGRNEVALQQTKSIIKNGKMAIVIADLTEQDEIDNVIKNINFKNGVQYLIHCAVTMEPYASLATVTRAELQKSIDINVMAPIFLTQTLAPYFDTTTRVLFIGSDYVGVTNKIRPHIAGAYGISKSALRVAVEYFRHECKDTALVGYLNPGSTDTPLFNAVKNAVINKHGIFNHPGKPADPMTVAIFIQAVLEKASSQDYSAIDWDFRTTEHHQKLSDVKKMIPSVQTKSKI
jgi:short-subunit dehydrogenase